MQVKILTDYALRILTYLAAKKGVVNSKKISDHLAIPQKYVLSIGRDLKTADYVSIINGPYGGYKINKNPEDLTLLSIVSLFEDTKINCHFARAEENQLLTDTAVNNLYTELQTMIEEKLRSETLADLVAKSAKKRSHMKLRIIERSTKNE